MKLATASTILALVVSPGHGLLSPQFPRQVSFSEIQRSKIFAPYAYRYKNVPSSLSMSDDDQRAERMRAVLAEEAMNPANMAASAEQMKNMKPEDIEKMMEEMNAMNPVQREQLKAMGMDPELMQKSMAMMKENPELMASAQKMMSKMTPEQLMQQSRLAQEQMAKMSPDQVEEASKALGSLSPDLVDKAADVIQDINANAPQEVKDADLTAPIESSSTDPKVIDVMFQTAELMSQPPSGGVTLKAFATLPPISVLSGDREEDLSAEELSECWADGALGATRVDRAGFERVWNEIRDYFEGDIMDEARKTAQKSSGVKVASASVSPAIPPISSPAGPTVGANLTPEQLSAVNERVKQMSDDDIGTMLDQMSNMGPEQEARMKAMGVDPAMMARTSKMMKENPMMRKAAQAMMKNMTPEQMMKTSQQAQQQMAGMSKEDYEKMMEKMSEGK